VSTHGAPRGRILTQKLASSPEGLTRVLRIYLPETYPRDPERFSVLYLQDGQNVFDAGAAVPVSWGVEAALSALAGGGRARFIAVAVEHRGAKRIGDYSPWPDPRMKDEPRGASYAEFFAEHLVPYVDKSFRTIPKPAARAVVGSSMGGLISLYIGARYPGVFGRVGALSPTAVWGGRELFRSFSSPPPAGPKIYIDAGARELFSAGEVRLDYGAAARELYSHLASLGYTEAEARLVLDPAGDHSEAAWRRRLPEALRWLLG
jgi:predicted alpha/beta superfamily hydrolase